MESAAGFTGPSRAVQQYIVASEPVPQLLYKRLSPKETLAPHGRAGSWRRHILTLSVCFKFVALQLCSVFVEFIFLPEVNKVAEYQMDL
jgi:hypothetical protein